MSGKFDLPMGIGRVIGVLLRKNYFSNNIFSVNRDGTMVVSLENEEEINKYQKLVLIIASQGLKITYNQIGYQLETMAKQCHTCSSAYQKSVYRCSFEIKEILHNYIDVTHAFMKGGERTETTKLELAKKFHKKKNMLNIFIRNNECQAKPLLEEYRNDALQILERWNDQHGGQNDFLAAKEALEKMWPLQLCGGIFYIEEQPVAYCLGEEFALGESFVIHFEKAVLEEGFKGVYQYINQAFASILPEKYKTVNREQDLGDPGLRHAKMSYRPVDFVKKYKVKSG